MTIMTRDALDVRHMIGIIKRSAPYLSVLSLIFIGIGIFVSTLFPIYYKSHTLIQIHTPQRMLDGEEPIHKGYISSDTALQNEIQSLTSEDLLRSVIHKMDISEDIHTIRNRLDVKPVNRSSVISIQYTNTDAENAQEFLNILLEEYGENQIKRKTKHIQNTNMWLQERLHVLLEKIDDLSSQIASAYTEDQQSYSKLHNLNLSIQKLSEESALLQVKITETSSTNGENLSSENLSNLKQKENSLKSTLASMRSRYGQKHPEIQRLQTELHEITKSITIEKNYIIKENKNLKSIYDSLNQEIQDLYAQKAYHDSAMSSIHMLEKQKEATQKLYDDFVNKYAESTEGALYQVPDHTIITHPTEAEINQSVPRFILVVFITFIIICIISILLLVRSITNPHIRTSDQIRNIISNCSDIYMIPENLQNNDLEHIVQQIIECDPSAQSIYTIPVYPNKYSEYVFNFFTQYSDIATQKVLSDPIKPQENSLIIYALQWDCVRENVIQQISNSLSSDKFLNKALFIIHHVNPKKHAQYGYQDSMIFFHNRSMS